MNIRPATMADRDELVRISKTHKAGNGFTNALMFSGQVHFDKGWLRVAEIDGKIVGFTCFRHKRFKHTKLYYIMVDPAARRGMDLDKKTVEAGTVSKGIGQALLDDLIKCSPHKALRLDCLKANTGALAFYDKNGFEYVGEGLNDAHGVPSAWVLEKTWE